MKNLNLTLLALFILLTSGNVAFSQNKGVFGKWVTIDDETNEKKSVVEIYERNGKVYGKIIKLYRKPGEDPDPVCDDCDDDDPRYMKKIIGMEIMTDMEKDGDEYSDGEILKPDEGKVYDCTIWRDGANLKVRGYILFLYRTQMWLPYVEE
ncbi:MAG: DUF2147 domain-containing protein [Cyclobacteriaceae bacterium]|nr:DUF2147 domain-containing protein [Cyclobacteriaceae bacterium]